VTKNSDEIRLIRDRLGPGPGFFNIQLFNFGVYSCRYNVRLIPEEAKMEDFVIVLTHTSDRILSWSWSCYDPRNRAKTEHQGAFYDSPSAALFAARAFLANFGATERFG
jgi:hypothetical protein